MMLLDAEIIFNGNVYKVESDTGCDEAEYAGVYSLHFLNG